MRGPKEFGAAFSALLEAARATPDSVVRALNAAVTRNTLYDWKKGTHLPSETGPFAQVVRLCLRLAGDSADLRGGPGDVEGWLDLLAEAKQTRDNRAAAAGRGPGSGRSSLISLDNDTLSEAAGFLAGRAARLLGELGNLTASRPERADELLRFLEEIKGRNQTPRCVARPKILPAADLSVAYQHVDLLRAHRKALLGRVSRDDRLLDTISALRAVLEEIHGVRIVFVGEKVTTRTDIGSTTPDASLAPTGFAIDFDPRVQDPIITTVKVLPDLAGAAIVAEGDPPEAVTPSGSIFVITLEARAPRAVILQGARAVVLSRRSPRRACFMKAVAGGLEVRRFDVDFDFENPQLRLRGEHDFPLTVSPNDPEEFWVQAETSRDEITWTVAVDWVVNGIAGTTLVNHGGSPFSLYPLDVLIKGPDKSPLRTRCDNDEHEEGCPSLILEQLGGSASTFTPDRGHRFTGIRALREMGFGG